MMLRAAELLAPAIPEAKGARRIVRLCEDDEEGGKMPKGVYDRSKAAPRRAPAEPASPMLAELPKAPKKRKARRTAIVVPIRKGVEAAPRFEVALDLRKGAVTINAAAGSLTLAADEIAALFAFLGRRT